MNDDSDEEGSRRPLRQRVFLQEVRDRAKAVSRNARGDADDIVHNIANVDEEGDDETKSYLIKIRTTELKEDESNVPKIVIEPNLSEEPRNDELQVQVSSVKLNLSAEYAKMGLAQKGALKRRRKPKIRWTLREDVFEAVPVLPDAVSDDESSSRSEEDLETAKKARTSNRYSAPVFAPSLMSDLGNALSRRNPRPMDGSNDSLNEESNKVPLGMPIAFKVAVGPKLNQNSSKSVGTTSASLVKNAAALKKTEITKEVKMEETDDKPAPWMKELGQRKLRSQKQTGDHGGQLQTRSVTTGEQVKVRNGEGTKNLLIETKVPTIAKADKEEDVAPWRSGVLKRRPVGTNDNNRSPNKENERRNSIDDNDDEREVVSPWAGVLKPLKNKTLQPEDRKNDGSNISSDTPNANEEGEIPEWKRYVQAKKDLKEKRSKSEMPIENPSLFKQGAPLSVRLGVRKISGSGTSVGSAKLGVSSEIPQGLAGKHHGKGMNDSIGVASSDEIKAEHGLSKGRELLRLYESSANTSDQVGDINKNVFNSSKYREIDIRSKDVNQKKQEQESDKTLTSSGAFEGAECTRKSSLQENSTPATVSAAPSWMSDLRKRRERYALDESKSSGSFGSDDGKAMTDELLGLLRRRRKKLSDADDDGSNIGEKNTENKADTAESHPPDYVKPNGDDIMVSSRKPGRGIRDRTQSSENNSSSLSDKPPNSLMFDTKQEINRGKEKSRSPEWVRKARLRSREYEKEATEARRKAEEEEQKDEANRKFKIEGKETDTPPHKSEAENSRTFVYSSTGSPRLSSDEGKRIAGHEDKFHGFNFGSQDAKKLSSRTPSAAPSPPPKPSPKPKPNFVGKSIFGRKTNDDTVKKNEQKCGSKLVRRVSIESKDLEDIKRPISKDVVQRDKQVLSHVRETKRETKDTSSLLTGKQGVDETTEKTMSPRTRRERRERTSPRRKTSDEVTAEKLVNIASEKTSDSLRMDASSNVRGDDKIKKIETAQETVETGSKHDVGKTDKQLLSQGIEGRLEAEDSSYILSRTHSVDETTDKFLKGSPTSRRERRERISPGRKTDEAATETHENYLSEINADNRLADASKDGRREQKRKTVDIEQEKVETRRQEDSFESFQGRSSLKSRLKLAESMVDSTRGKRSEEKVDERSLPDEPSKSVLTEAKTRLENGEEEGKTPGVQEQISSVAGFRSRVQLARDKAMGFAAKIDQKTRPDKDRRERTRTKEESPKVLVTETKPDDKPEWLKLRRKKIKEATRKLEPGQGDWV